MRAHAPPHLHAELLDKPDLIRGGCAKGGACSRTRGLAQPEQLKFGGQAQHHDLVLLQEVQRHLADGGAAHDQLRSEREKGKELNA